MELAEVKSEEPRSEVFAQRNIKKILENIKRLEKKEIPVANIDAGKVKDLLGNLYMELLFPHNDKETFIGMPGEEEIPKFDRKI